MNILGTDNKGFYVELYPIYMSMERALTAIVQKLINIGAEEFSITILGYRVSFTKELADEDSEGGISHAVGSES